MSINAEKFPNTGESVQVGGMSGGLTATTAIAVSGVIEVAEVTGAGVWVAFGASGMSAPSADAANAYFIPPFGVTRPFIVSDSYTHIRSSGTKINVRSLNVA
jgi:hypothetical protein